MRLPVPNLLVEYLMRRATRTPYFHLHDYMNRWWLVPYVDNGTHSDHGCGPVTWRRPIAKLMQRKGVAARVHEILRSDEAGVMHDHPWSYLTIILRGGYYEHTPDGVKWYGRGSVLWRPHGVRHRLELKDDQPATTLFITGTRQSHWGFHTKSGFVPSRQFKGKR